MITPNKSIRFKIFRKSEGTIKQRYFSSRLVNVWNELSDETVSVETLDSFKARLGQISLHANLSSQVVVLTSHTDVSLLNHRKPCYHYY